MLKGTTQMEQYMTEPVYMNEDQFDELFTSRSNPEDGSTIWEHHQVKCIDVDHVWSVLDGDNDKQFLVPGFHIVGNAGYVVTEESHAMENYEVLWFDLEDYRPEDPEGPTLSMNL